jgi:hypothetical protein
MAEITAEGSEYHGCHPHEILSALILKSSHVKDYVNKLEEKYRVQFKIDEAADWIVGKYSEKNSAYLAHVINGPFDADKLDYLFRDSHFSGLPLSLDLDRLWASADLGRHPDTDATILTLHQSSVVALEQILFNKINLFTIVYQHPKVRAGECVFQAAIRRIRMTDGYNLAGRALNKATDFLWITDSTFFSDALRRPKNHELHRMIHDILYRRHPVRAITISPDTQEGKTDNDKAAFRELRRLNYNAPEDVEERRELASEIWKQAGEPCDEDQVCLDLPPSPTLAGADHTYVRAASGSLRKLTDFFPMNYWNQSYMSYKWRGHVFCPYSCQQAVYVAAKKVFEERYGLRFKRLAGDASHVPSP